MIFLSKTSSEPYEIISENNPLTFINNLNDLEDNELIIENEKDIYLIVKSGYSYPNIRVVVENEYFTGSSFMISKTNPDGSPIEYKKSLNFGDLNATSEDLVIRIKVKFSTINNEYLLKSLEFPANINIYSN